MDQKYLTDAIVGDYSHLPCILNLTDVTTMGHPASTMFEKYSLSCFEVCIQWGSKAKYSKYTEIVRMPHIIQAVLQDNHDESSAKNSHDTLLRRPRGRKFDPDMLRSWLQICKAKHGPVCHSSENQQMQRLRLIDVHRRCLTEFGPPSGVPRYLTLSYLWGQGVQRLTLSNNNLGQLYTPGALTGLARSIEDAMNLVKDAGERYLWVDALCIIQDDSDDQSIWIPQMNLIYGGSILTLAAVYGEDADAGLPGVSINRQLPHTVSLEQFALTVATGVRLDNDSLIHSSWRQRGWTFQEELLSRRLVYFREECIHWKCAGVEWFEELDAEGSCLPFRRAYSGTPTYVSLSPMNF